MKKINVIRLFSLFLPGVLILLLNSCFNFEMAEPTPAPEAADCPLIAAGYVQSLVLCGDRSSLFKTLWAWGDNQFGQLGCGPIPYFRNTPMHIGPG